MKNKSHFWYNKSQRNGILYLAILIIILQFSYYFIDFSSEEVEMLNTPEIVEFQQKIDSLKLIEMERRKPKIYPFNPSFITDYKGYKLGMSVEELDKLFAFRKQGKYINSVQQFQDVTGVSDSLLLKISPFFKFPDWLNKKVSKKQNTKTSFQGKKIDLNLATIDELQQVNGIGDKLSKRIVKFKTSIGGYQNITQLKKVYGLKPNVVHAILERFYIKKGKLNKEIKDLNQATAEELKSIYGIGDKLSNRIIAYRNSIGGFYFEDQLYEVFGLKPEVIAELRKYFKILSKPTITKVNVNEATFKQVLHLPYIDYELTKKIFDYRDEFAEIQHIEELKKIEGFPLDKYDRIALYLSVE